MNTFFRYLFGSKKDQSSKQKSDYVLVSEDGISLSDEQKNVIRMMETTNKNFFITGKAGTGKSVVLRTFSKNTKKKVVILAPTGIAAIVAKGETIHSFFGLSTQVQNTCDKNTIQKGIDKLSEKIRNVDTIIIDEISMVRSDIMDMIDKKLQAARERHAPFGGCQMIVFGDLLQLPPVVEKDEDVAQFLNDKYHTFYFFGAPAVAKSGFNVVELNQVFRQKDAEFIDVLNQIRIGDNSLQTINRLNSLCKTKHDQEISLVLTPSNKDAARINSEELAKLSTEEFIYHGRIEGEYKKDDLPTEMILRLKVGAQIMMLANDSQKRWANGTIGTIVDLERDFIQIKVPTGVHIVDKHAWSKYKYQYNPQKKSLQNTVVGKFYQYPIKLAYAVTIHKSQGQTYDTVCIDYTRSRAFALGQTYVALSRCKNPQKLYVKDTFISEDIRASQEALSYLNGTYKPEPVDESVGYVEKTKIIKDADFCWSKSHRRRISVDTDKIAPPKKITGSRLPHILWSNRYGTPFTKWCEIMHVYEPPFTENQYTVAGKIIESIQYEYLKKQLTNQGYVFYRPRDLFDESVFDFFPTEDVLGGMWDCIAYKDGKPAAVFEMKTTKMKNRYEWGKSYPNSKSVQAALYAYLLGVDDFFMVSSFLTSYDYSAPSRFVCTPYNTTIDKFDFSSHKKEFEDRVVKPMLAWWENYVVTGLSPEYDESNEADMEALRALRKRNAPDQTEYFYAGGTRYSNDPFEHDPYLDRFF